MELMEYAMHSIAMRPREQIREAIRGLQEHMQDMLTVGHIDDCPVQHVFAPGTYSREITMPEGMLIVGRLHRHAHVNILSKGRCRVLTEFGAEELVAPCIFMSEAATKRVVYIIEDTVWTTVHHNPTDERDVQKLLLLLSAEEYADIEIQGELV